MIWYKRWLDIDPDRINELGVCTGVKGEMLCTFSESGRLVTSCNNDSVRPDQKSVCESKSHTYDLSLCYNDVVILKRVHNFMSSWSRPGLRSVTKISNHVYPGKVVNKINFGHSFRLELTATQPRCTSLGKMITTLDTPYRFKEI